MIVILTFLCSILKAMAMATNGKSRTGGDAGCGERIANEETIPSPSGKKKERPSGLSTYTQLLPSFLPPSEAKIECGEEGEEED